MNVNIQALAFLGDAIFSLYIRGKLLEMGINNLNKLQKKSIGYVSAKNQVKILNNLIENNLLSDEEIEIVKRGRNNKRSSHPKNTDIITYKLSTGFEGLIGYLYLNDRNRLDEILSLIEVK